jgi:peptide/nickel transport system substrate-binding protein
MSNPHEMGFPTPIRDHPHSRRVLVQLAAALGIAASAAAIYPDTVLGQSGSPVPATPTTSGTRSSTRDEYLAAVRQHFALQQPVTRGGHVLSAHLRAHQTLNPIVAADTRSVRVLENLFSALVRPSLIDGSWAPDLADDWEISADGLVYTFRLNRNATWHDGRPVTAHDCVFTLDAVFDERSLSGIRSVFITVIEGYRALDDHTFELVAKQPIATLLENSVGGLAILPRHIWEPVPLEEWGAAPGATGSDPSQVIGSGPFRFKEWVRDGHVSIVRNDAYWVPEMIPAIDEFTWRVLPETSTTVQALIAGEIDFCGVPPVQVEPLQNSNPELAFTMYDDYAWEQYILNGDPERVPFFTDPRVRQAMLYALDRDALIANILDGYGTRADGIYPPSSTLYAPERVTTIYDYDPAWARSLLDEAGWVETGDRGRVKDGVSFRVEMLYPDAGELRRQTATYLQQAWREVGIEVEVTATAFPILIERMDAGDFEVLIINRSWGDDQGYLYRCDAFPPNGGNAQRICNPEFDRLNAASLFELDPVMRRELLIEQGNVVHDAATLGLLYFSKTILASKPRLRNFFANASSLAGCLPWLWLADDE